MLGREKLLDRTLGRLASENAIVRMSRSLSVGMLLEV
jgi:hypothetical protein